MNWEACPGSVRKPRRDWPITSCADRAEYANALAEAIVEVKERTRLCAVCFNITEDDPCAICSDPERKGADLRRGGAAGCRRAGTHR